MVFELVQPDIEYIMIYHREVTFILDEFVIHLMTRSVNLKTSGVSLRGITIMPTLSLFFFENNH